MRKIVLGFAMSLDGYIARPDGAVRQRASGTASK
jgi:hypothetical protein